jgi:hypothetical protein
VTAATIERLPARKPNSRQGSEPCDGQVSEPVRKWAERLGRRPRCSFAESYLVRGKKLCERHAGKELISLMIEKGQEARPTE